MALKPLNSVGGFSVGEVPANVILSNADITANKGTFSGNLAISNAVPTNGVLTDNLYYANGVAWDFQQAAGSNGELQFNMGDDFAASPNLTFDNSTQLFKVTGNANITGTLTVGSLEVDEIFNGNSNVAIPVANGNVNVSVAGNANVLVVTGTGVNVAGYVTASSTLTGSNLSLTDGNIVSTGSSGLYLTPANSTAGIVLYANTIPNANNSFNLGGTSKVWAEIYSNNITVTSNVSAGNAALGNLATVNYANITNDINVLENVKTGNIQVNVSANLSNLQVANFVVSNLTPTSDDQYSLGTTSKRWKDINIAGNANIATANISGNITAGNIEFGNLLTGNFATFDNDVQVLGNIANANNVSATNGIFANNANITANLTSGNANLGNLATANFVNVAQNLSVTGNIAGTYANLVGNLHIAPSGANNFGILTDHLYYANGTAWDLQEAAGSNTEIQYNSNDNFAASANFTYDDSTQVFKVTGNANITNTVITPNLNSLGGNLALISNNNSTVFDNTGNVTFPAGGTVTAGTFVGNVQANITITAANTTVLFSDAGLVDGSTGFTFNKTSNLVSMTGNVNLGPAGVNQLVNLSNTALEIRGGWNSTAGAVNIVAGDYSNSTLWGKLSIQGNVGGNAVGYSEANAFVFTTPGAGAGNVVKVDTLNTAAANTTSGALQVAGGLGVTGNGYFGNLSVTGDIANANNISVTNTLNAVTGNFSGNVNSLNANLGNLAQANFVNVASNIITSNLTVNLALSGNTATFSGNVEVNNLDVNLELSGNTANFSGNVVVPNLTVNAALVGSTGNFSGNITSLNANLGNLADANYIRTGELMNGNSNIIIAPNGNISVSATGTANVLVVSNVGANIIGYVTANGDGTFGAVKSNTLTAQGGNLTIYAASGDNYVEIRPTGNGQVDVGNHRITSLGTPVASTDAATKGYVDAAVEGLHVHAPCVAATPDTLANISVGTVTYNNGTAGVGANLVTTGSYTLIDGVNIATAGTRILVKDEANAAHNGIYTYANSTTLVRATDFDTPTEMGGGDFTFVQQGTIYNDTGWVMTDPVTTVGTSPVNWLQFSGAGEYSAGAGLTLTGTVFSVNVDNVTTEIAGGNVVVKANAQLTTPNIGAATGTSVDLTGNVLANNLNANALITGANINITANVLTGNVNANANVLTNNATVNLSLTGNTANFSGNVLVNNFTTNLELAGNTANFSGAVIAQNVTANSTVFSANSNVSGTTITNVLTVNNALGGNTANFSGNVLVNNFTTNLELVGNTANFSGNVILPNLTVNLEVAGNTANFTGNVRVNNFVSNGLANVGNLHVTANVTSALTPNANLTLDLGSSSQRWQDIYAGNIDASGNFTVGGNISANNYTANIITANTQVNIGNTEIRAAEVTTSTTSANQAISTVAVSGISGVEWIVKGMDTAGSGKYSMAIITAITDGTSVDYAQFGGVNLGSTTGTLAVNIVGSNIELQVTPSSSNSTIWVTQYRTI